MNKRIVICSDGTWNTPDQKDGGENRPSNVVKMARAIAANSPDGKPQIVFYDQGVGTSWGLDRLTGGAFGKGLEKNIEDAYRFLMHNFEDGDEIFFFGFSRGAYTVRSTAGLIRNSGILKKIYAEKFPEAYKLYRKKDVHPDSEKAKQFRSSFSQVVTTKFIGVWDTVGALGIPVRGLRFLTKGLHEFHDVELSRFVKNAFHALAIDEKRGPFKPSLWESKKKEGQVIEQVWFAGVHSNIGGGYQDSGLSDITFKWMKEKAENCGLAIDEKYIDKVIHPNPAGVLRNSKVSFYKFTKGYTRPIGQGKGDNEAVHPKVVVRHKVDPPPYRPKNLVEYLKKPEHRVAKVKGRE
jgi:uncharacterized protein (DUF2235 family)